MMLNELVIQHKSLNDYLNGSFGRRQIQTTLWLIFSGGGGTTAAVAQRLGRRWITSDQSRVAVAVTADRLAQGASQRMLEGVEAPVPDFTVEHWGIYEAKRLSESPPDEFRKFILSAFGARPDNSKPDIHGWKSALPVWVGEPGQRTRAGAKDVEAFANAIRKNERYKLDNLREGVMVAWAFGPDAAKAAELLRAREKVGVNFIRLDMVKIDSPRFREHVSALNTDHADYSTFLTFVQPPKVEVGARRIAPKTYKFDVSDTQVFNAGAKIINVQWDFHHGARFVSTPGYSFVRCGKDEPELQAQFEFPRSGKFKIACKVQDDMGGEGMWTGEIEVS